jgi:hypothetical protein
MAESPGSLLKRQPGCPEFKTGLPGFFYFYYAGCILGLRPFSQGGGTIFLLSAAAE